MELQMIDNSELAPYLAGLNVGEALEDFARLADRVLSASPPAPTEPVYQHQQQQHLHHHQATTTFDEHRYQPQYGRSVCSPSSCLASDESSVLSPGSPGGASLYSTVATSTVASLHWSEPSSPVASEHSFAYSSSSCSSGSSSSSSSALSSPSRHYYSSSSCSSAASSVCGDQERRQRRTIKKGGDRKRQNASAAERYRRKQRGRQSGLDEELERERERNSKLMQNFEAKLELYREFVNLLAANTRDPSQDLDLARLGSSSLENILERICPAEFLAYNDRQRSELERLQDHFKRVLSFAQFYQR